MKYTNVYLNPNFYIAFFLFAGRTSLLKFGIPIEVPLGLSLVFLIIIVLLSIKKWKDLDSLQLGIYEFLLFLFLFISVFSLFYSPSPNAFEKTFELFILISFCFLLLLTLRNREDFISLLLGFLLIGSIFTLAGLPNIITFSGGRSTVLGVGYNTLGRFMFMVTVCSLLIVFLYKKKSFLRLWIFFVIIITLLLIVMSGSRGSYLGIIICLISLLVFNFKRVIKTINNFKYTKHIFYVMLLMFIMGFFFSDQILYFYNSRFLFLFSDVQGGTAVSIRKDMFKEAFNLFLEKPILGNGLDSFPYYSNYNIYPHNIFLEVATELGLIGLILLLLIIVIGFICLFKIKSKSVTYFNIMLSLLIFNLTTVQVSGDLYDSRLLFFTLQLIIILSRNEKIYTGATITSSN